MQAVTDAPEMIGRQHNSFAVFNVDEGPEASEARVTRSLLDPPANAGHP